VFPVYLVSHLDIGATESTALDCWHQVTLCASCDHARISESSTGDVFQGGPGAFASCARFQSRSQVLQHSDLGRILKCIALKPVLLIQRPFWAKRMVATRSQQGA
jgi:hypothetical protein